MSSVWSFAFLWCFESLAAGAPTEELKEGKRHAALSVDRAERLLDFIHFIPLPRVPRHPASGK